MRIKNSTFIASYADVKQIPRKRLSEIAFVGRSNVGKSSLINRLMGRKQLAKTSKKPGKTRLLNYFLINESFHFVDLPGYGFARVSQSERKRWQNLIESYIESNSALRLVVSLVDSRHGPTVLDLNLLDWLSVLEVPVLMVATKIDKLNNRQMQKSKNEITAALETRPVDGPVFFSSLKGVGKQDVLQSLESYLEK